MKVLYIFLCIWAYAQSLPLENIDEKALEIFPEDASFDMNTLSEQDKILFGRCRPEAFFRKIIYAHNFSDVVQSVIQKRPSRAPKLNLFLQLLRNKEVRAVFRNEFTARPRGKHLATAHLIGRR